MIISTELNKTLTQSVSSWFYNKTYRTKKATKRYRRKWYARDVYFHRNKKLCRQRALAESGHQAGDRKYLGVLQKVIATMFKELTEDEQEEYTNKAKEWNTEGVPREVQLK
jgi:hypothetical protein